MSVKARFREREGDWKSVVVSKKERGSELEREGEWVRKRRREWERGREREREREVE